MRSLESSRESWQELQQYKSLRELKDAVRLDNHLSVATSGLRSACWKAFLLFESLDVSDWLKTLASSRSAYNSLRTHFFRYIENPDDVGASFDPLSQDAEMQKDQELRAEIQQDVDRCMPDSAYFRQPETQRMLLDVLFVFCKLNPDVGYRQGMHEIAAPILWVIEQDAVDMGGASKVMGEDSVLVNVFDAEHIEHDTFAIFGQVMQSAKTFYISEGPVSIASRSRHIFNELLLQVDATLMKHLEGLDIVPQVFLIRWIRLLFGREFDFNSVLALWDVIFAEDPSLEIVDHICVAMLLRIRWHLLDADYNNALGLLLRYPEQDKDFPAQTFGLDAMYLATHMNKDGGSYLLLKYTGRPLALSRATTPPALQRNITTFSGDNTERRSGLPPSQTSRQPRQIEALLQSTAKNIYARGEKLGIGKVVRSAVDEVHKKAQEIREAQTPSTPPWRRPGGPDRLIDKMKILEDRNKRLSLLLSGAINELWEYQRLITEDEKAEDHTKQAESVEKLSTAIAKVQFVQVYLDEPSLSLPEDEATSGKTAEDPLYDRNPLTDMQAEKASEEPREEPPLTNVSSAAHTGSAMALPSTTSTQVLADPSTFEHYSEPSTPLTQQASARQHQQNTTASNPTDTQASSDLEKKSDVGSPHLQTPRPTLEQSPFSFMLGQEKDTQSQNDFKKLPVRSKPEASLFGEEPRSRSASRRLAAAELKESTGSLEAGQDEFDLGSLRRAKGSKK